MELRSAMVKALGGDLSLCALPVDFFDKITESDGASLLLGGATSKGESLVPFWQGRQLSKEEARLLRLRTDKSWDGTPLFVFVAVYLAKVHKQRTSIVDACEKMATAKSQSQSGTTAEPEGGGASSEET